MHSVICFYQLNHKHNDYFHAGFSGGGLWSTTHIVPLCENVGPIKRDHLAGSWLSTLFTRQPLHPTNTPTCQKVQQKDNFFPQQIHQNATPSPNKLSNMQEAPFKREPFPRTNSPMCRKLWMNWTVVMKEGITLKLQSYTFYLYMVALIYIHYWFFDWGITQQSYCNRSIHNLFQVRSLHICNGNLGQLIVTAL